MPEVSGGARKVGVAIVGMGGAVATTAIAGIELLRQGSNSFEGLPLAGVNTPGLAAYRDLYFGGWDLNGDDLATAAGGHNVLTERQIEAVRPAMSAMSPWAAVGSKAFCVNVDGTNKMKGGSGHRDAVQAIRDDLRNFRKDSGCDGTVMVNLASVESWPDLATPALQTAEQFERGLDADDPAIGPAMLYAYAALFEDVPYANFTPSLAADVPALVQLAEQRNVPIAGKDGKTGQTMLKTVIAPALRSRALHVDGWFSTNILGNRDGQALDNPASLASKLATKASVLDSILGYHVEDHVVTINYYRPRGDDKEAWDNIDIVGFLGQKMQIKLNFMCKDSILAAPLVVEMARVLDLASQRGDGGVQEQLGLFFKAPMTRGNRTPEHALHTQETALMDWLSRH